MDGDRANPLALLQYPFAAGIDEGTRDELVEPGAGWAVLENGRQDKRGGYSTRHGFTALTSTRTDATAATSGYKLFADRDTVVRISDTLEAETYSPTAGRWRSLGKAPECAARVIDVPSMADTSYLEDIDATNGYLAIAWLATTTAGTAPTAAILDQATGAVIRAPEAVGTTITIFTIGAPLLAVQGNYFVLVRMSVSGTAIEGYYLDTTSATTIANGWVLIGNLATDHCAPPLAATAVFAVHSLPHASTPRVAVAYVNDSAGASQLTVKTFNITGVVQTQVFGTGGLMPVSVGLAGNATDTLWITWNQGTAVVICGVSPFTISSVLASQATLFSTGSASPRVDVVPSPTTGIARVLANDTTAFSWRIVTTSGGAAVASGATNTAPATQMARKPFYYAGRYYCGFTGGDAANLQLNMVVCDFTAAATFVRPVANPVPGLSSSSLRGQGKFVAGSAATTFYVGLAVRRSGVADGSALVELDFASTKRWQPAAFGSSSFLSGGLPSYSDGVRVAEVGFLIRPITPTIVNAGGTGVTGTFKYICVFEEVDSDGNWHQSGLSSPSASSGAIVDDTLTITTSALAITARITASTVYAQSVRVAFYRTLTGGATPYYRLATVANDTAAASISYSDTMSDAVLATKAKLYSQPGVQGTSQDKRPPPAFTANVAYGGMLVGAFGSDLWPSGQNVSGEGAWFNPIFQVPVPGDGDITALWVMDGTLFVAKRREIYAVTGEAPSDNASSGGLGTPRKLSVDVGCIEPRSVCTTAFGTFFQSERGIEILNRSGAVEWIGEGIQDTVAAFPICTSITVEPVSNTVLVELASSQASGLVAGTGRTAVYDLLLKVWASTDRRKSSAGVADTPSQSACMIYTGSVYRYAWISAAGVVHYENAASYLEADGTFIAKRAVSANTKAGGPQGCQHINKTLLLARYHTAHDLNMSFAYDYNSSYKTARLYTAAQIAALVAVVPNEQLEHTMHDDADCEAVRVQLQDVTPSSGALGTGQGATWIALAFELVPQQGAYSLPDEAR